MSSPGVIVTTLAVAMLLLAAAFCGEALACAGCGHACCAKTSVGDFFRRLLVGIVATVAAALGLLPSLSAQRLVAFRVPASSSGVLLSPVPLRI